MARSAGASFVAHLHATRALRVGYLRSYDGAANVSVRMECAGHETRLFTLRRQWRLNASIYTSTTLRLLAEDVRTPELWRATFTLQPGATSSFTVYSLKSS